MRDSRPGKVHRRTLALIVVVAIAVAIIVVAVVLKLGTTRLAGRVEVTGTKTAGAEVAAGQSAAQAVVPDDRRLRGVSR
jgi:hypothetical protein